MKKNSSKKNSSGAKKSTAKSNVSTSKNVGSNVSMTAYDKLPELGAGKIGIRALILMIPAVVALLASFALRSAAADVFIWWAAFYLYSWAAFPIVAHFFRGFVSAGFGFSRSLGLVLTSGAIWLISYLGIFESFSRPMTIVAFFVLAGVSWGVPKTRNSALIALADDSNIKHILFEEILFIAIFTILLYCKAMSPTINGEEKFMNFGFMNSMVRYDGLPAKDPWLSGHSINYYYYGQYMFSYMTKMLGTTTGIAYNIAMCASIALPFMSAFSLGQLFLDGLMQKRDCPVSKWYLPFAGILSSACVILFGNSHSFFFDEESIGNGILHWGIWDKLGVIMTKKTDFFYADSTRYIGHNPHLVNDLGLAVGDETIHEFPFYSYLIGDLHAHVVSMTIVMLITAFLFVLVFRAAFPKDRSEKMWRFTNLKKNIIGEMQYCFRPELFFVAFFLGLSQMCNYWDFLIYFIFSAMALLVYNGRRSNYLITFSSGLVFLFELVGILGVYLKFSNRIFVHLILQVAIFVISYLLTTVFPSAFSRTGVAMSMLFSLSSFIALTFNYNFDMISNSIKLTDRHTPLFQFTILWITHFSVAFCLIALVVFTQRRKYKKVPLPVLPEPLELEKPSMAIEKRRVKASAVVEETSDEIDSDPDGLDSTDPDDSLDPDVIIEKAHIRRAKAAPAPSVQVEAVTSEEDEDEDYDVQPGLLGRLLLLLKTLDYYLARFGDFLMTRFFNKRSIVDIFMVGVSVVGMMMIIAPEIIYVPDIYGADYERSNTMFKFTFAGFIMLSLVMAYTVFRFMAHVTKKGHLSNWGLTVAILLIILILFVPGNYTFRALNQRAEISSENFKGIDGTAYLETYESRYYSNDGREPTPSGDWVDDVYQWNYTDHFYPGNLMSYKEATDWLNANEKRSVNICEAYGYSYSDKCIVSAYTGLPTVIGWNVHEWLWHAKGTIDPETHAWHDDPVEGSPAKYINPRHADVDTIYHSSDEEEVRTLLHLYDVTYVIMGDLELSEFGEVNYTVLDKIGEKVFTSSDGSLTIYKVQ